MWKWIDAVASLFRKSPAPPDGDVDRFDMYSPREREIYQYSDGEKIVRADPMVLYRKVMEVGQELSVDIKIANLPFKEAPAAHDAMLRKIRAIFNVKPFEEGGLTQTETADLLDHFLLYVYVIKKNGSPPATSPTGTSPATPTVSTESPPTSSSSASTSTSGESSTATPPPSPSVAESPSGPLTPALSTTSP